MEDRGHREVSGHLHGHSHHGVAAASPRLRRGLVAVVAAVAVLSLIGTVVWWPRGEAPELYVEGTRPVYVDASVASVRTERCPGVETDVPVDCDIVQARLTTGQLVEVRVFLTDPGAPRLVVGDGVVLLEAPTAAPEFRYMFADFQRDPPLVILALMFVAAVVLLARWRGVRALAGIVVSFGVLLVFLLPALLRGAPALPVALVGTVLIAMAALYIAHGVHIGTTVALLGTLVSLSVIAALAAIFVGAARLTGFADEDAQVLRITAEAVDLRGLLIAGIVIGALGVLDDVTVTQVSAVAELRRARPEWSPWQLYRAAVRIGRDHIASTVNTLVLAYVGASLPLLVLFVQGGQPWARLGASELVAIELVRTLTGSIGLVLAVPLTTALAALVLVAPGEDGGADEAADGDPASGVAATGDTAAARWDSFGPAEDPW